MGDPRKIRKKYGAPRHPFERHRIDSELQLIGKYGLRNMRSIWRHNTMLRNFRSISRSLLSLSQEDRVVPEQELLGRIQRLGLIGKDSTLDDVLSLKIEDVLNRRLQTLVFKKGMALTPHQARQMITHKHIVIGDRIMDSPSYLVPLSEETMLNFSPHSPFANPEHAALPDNVKKQKKEARPERKERRGGRGGRSSRGGRSESSSGGRRPSSDRSSSRSTSRPSSSGTRTRTKKETESE